MKINPNLINEWPKLAWVAAIAHDSDAIVVNHGAMVETSENWVVEGVWAGNFEKGNFDKTDLIFGSGVRIRDGKAVFVTSGTCTDRVWYCSSNSHSFVANSLPAILAASGLSLNTERHYFRDIRTICNGINTYKKRIPVTEGEVYVHYYHNLVYEDNGLKEKEKPDPAPHFDQFETYYLYLKNSAEKLASNMTHADRKNRVEPFTTVSSGYDSCASAVVAMFAGANQAATIRQSASFWRGSDSGEEVAKYLGIKAVPYDIKADYYPHEYAVWAVSGRASILNWAQFDFPKPLCAIFTGCRGDAVWDRNTNIHNPFKVPSVSDMGICEWRLIAGVFHVVVPFWGIRHVAELQNISQSLEMKSWSLGGNYDRPIARRIVEQAGVPRNKFGVLKKNSSSEEYFTWPYSSDAEKNFRTFLKERNIFCPPKWMIPVYRKIIQWDRLFFLNVTSRFKLPDLALRIRLRLRANRLLFHWAVYSLKKIYLKGLSDSPFANKGND